MIWLKICGSMASSSQFTGLIFSHSCEAIKRRKEEKQIGGQAGSGLPYRINEQFTSMTRVIELSQFGAGLSD
jgi:hypothetical protein